MVALSAGPSSPRIMFGKVVAPLVVEFSDSGEGSEA
jgi:hypothetical protein